MYKNLLINCSEIFARSFLCEKLQPKVLLKLLLPIDGQKNARKCFDSGQRLKLFAWS